MRSACWAAPMCPRRGILMKKSVVIAICASTNMKITTKEDYKLVETYFKNETSGDNKCIK